MSSFMQGETASKTFKATPGQNFFDNIKVNVGFFGWEPVSIK